MIEKLGNIATYLNGYAFKPSDWSESGLPIIRIQDLTGTSAKPNYYEKTYDKKYEINEGDVLISWSASLGVYVWHGRKALLNQHIFKVIFDKIAVDKDFFVYQVEYILKKATALVHGATMQHLTRPVFNNLPFKLFPIERQQKIALTLNTISTLINDRQKQLQYLDGLIKSQFIEMFGDVGKYELKSLAEVTEVIAGGDKPKDISENLTEEYCYPVYANGVDNEGLQCYSKEYRVEKEAVTISARGTIGATFIRQPFFTPIVRLIAVVPNREVNVTYLKYAIDALGTSSTGSSQQQLTVPNIKKEMIAVPPLEKQKEFEQFIWQSDKSRLAGEKASKIKQNMVKYKVKCNIL
ncbi:restriction endonuclease subunit S [uncultured Acidaminococcus sp.]|uniref:restriction endonuclease subunit S n=2 Tax=uncultured Acidaminococcus sp. TaxID=352152 RepID=UPI002666C6C2|nr:restriction endonuclease subunit S [uncultured Acidaminococcus sp.]